MNILLLALGLTLLLLFFFVSLLWYWVREIREHPRLGRLEQNPILRPRPEHWWESEAVFNPAAFVDRGRVHLLYRALGKDGISRIGYASSPDGITFDERLSHPVYDHGPGFAVPPSRLSYAPLSYNTDLFASGGGWGGCEDPRAVTIDSHVYMSFSIFEGWESMRLAITALHLDDLEAREWKWQPHIPISRRGERNKNWVLFPEKINGKFAILHALTPEVLVTYVDSLETLRESPIQSNNNRGGRPGHWDAFVRGAAAPPIKTSEGWLLLYHGMDPAHPGVGYKVGAMLLGLQDPTTVLYRSNEPILTPETWYENDWKPGVVYASGAVVLGSDLLVYYGGGDKYIAAARTDLRQFLRKLMQHQQLSLMPE